MKLQVKLALFIILALVIIAAFAEEIEIASVYIPIDELSYLHCEMQTQEELKHGFVDFTTCIYCRIAEGKQYCIQKKQDF